MSIFKRGNIYWYKFMWHGELIRKSTEQGNDRKARQIEAAHRTRLARQQDEREDAQRRLRCDAVLLCDECERWFEASKAQNRDGHVFCANACLTAWGKKHRRIPTLGEFFKEDFLPYNEAHFAAKEKTRDYYSYGTELLLEAAMGSLLLNEITGQHGARFMAKKAHLSPSTVNCGLRTLRRAMNLAEKWGKLDRAPKIELAKGERQRERVVTLADFLAYQELCRQPWRDVVTVMYGTGMRPSENYTLRWERVVWADIGGRIQIGDTKTPAGRRDLPMVSEVYSILKARHEAQGHPRAGWVFPAATESGHFEESSAKHLHGEAREKLENASAAYQEWSSAGGQGDWLGVVAAASKLERDFLQRHGAAIQAGWSGFQPYCLRHTALTNLATFGVDAFTLKLIAGHKSIRTTEKYIHPQRDAVERAFQTLAGGHNFGHTPELPEPTASSEQPVTRCEIVDLYGAPGEIRTPGLLIRSQSLYPAELRAHICAIQGESREKRTTHRVPSAER